MTTITQTIRGFVSEIIPDKREVWVDIGNVESDLCIQVNLYWTPELDKKMSTVGSGTYLEAEVAMTEAPEEQKYNDDPVLKGNIIYIRKLEKPSTTDPVVNRTTLDYESVHTLMCIADDMREDTLVKTHNDVVKIVPDKVFPLFTETPDPEKHKDMFEIKAILSGYADEYSTDSVEFFKEYGIRVFNDKQVSMFMQY